MATAKGSSTITNYDDLDSEVVEVQDQSTGRWVREIELDPRGPLTIGTSSKTGNDCLKVQLEPINPGVVQFLWEHYDTPIVREALEAIRNATMVEMIKDALNNRR